MTDKVGIFTRPRVLLPLLLALILQLAPSSDPPTGLGTEYSTPTSNYVVRFLDYRPAEDHRTYLEANLRSRDLWRWIERRNPAAQFPTDFGVVSIGDSHREALTSELGRLGRVKDVTADSSYSRTIFMDGSADADVKKPSGKIFTAMSFEDEGEGVFSPVVNASINWRRKLMTERSQVTSLFGAERLWGKGFTGARVKMAIFDTGIRANHPHFRNIKERTNWTNEDTLNDNLGHGTFVAGVIAGEDTECLGFAPDTEIYAFRVFTDAQVLHRMYKELISGGQGVVIT